MCLKRGTLSLLVFEDYRGTRLQPFRPRYHRNAICHTDMTHGRCVMIIRSSILHPPQDTSKQMLAGGGLQEAQERREHVAAAKNIAEKKAA